MVWFLNFLNVYYVQSCRKSTQCECVLEGGHIFEELGCVIMDTAFCNLETNDVSFSSKAAWFQTKRTTFSLHPRTKEANVLHKVLAGTLSLF